MHGTACDAWNASLALPHELFDLALHGFDQAGCFSKPHRMVDRRAHLLQGTLHGSARAASSISTMRQVSILLHPLIPGSRLYP